MPEGDRFFAQLGLFAQLVPSCCRPVGFTAGFTARFTAGFTLLELLVVVAIGVILAAIAVPALTNLVAANQLAGMTDTFVSALYEARSEAGKLGVPVALKTANGAGTNWGVGWTSFVDTNANGQPDIGQGTPPEVIL